MSLQIVDNRPQLNLTSQSSNMTLGGVVQELSIQQTSSSLAVNDFRQTLAIVADSHVLDMTKKTLQVDLVPNSLNINQYFSGEGAVADQDTIVGAGTQFDPLRAPDMLRVSLKLGEFSTAADKQEAITNLGLHIIDGGTFTY